MKSKQVRKLETLHALIVEFHGYYATCDDPQLPHGYYLGATLDDALEGAARAATELMKQERMRRETDNATATIKR